MLKDSMKSRKIHKIVFPFGQLKNFCYRFVSGNRFEKVLNWLRKLRTWSLKMAFAILVLEDILTGKKPHELLPPDVSLKALFGTILIFCGVFLRLWARGHFMKGQLFKTGPYRFVRHPLYLGSTIVVLGVLFILNDYLNWIIIPPLLIIFHGSAIIYEERSMEKKFSKDWQEYKANVPAIIPSPTRYLSLKGAFKWRWQVFRRTTEPITSLLLLSLPIFIEIMEEYAFS